MHFAFMQCHMVTHVHAFFIHGFPHLPELFFLWRAIFAQFEGCLNKMAYFEQAACLATAWANDDELCTLGAKQSLYVISGKKLMRRFLDPHLSI